MLEGLYKVKFRTGGDAGSCICLFKNGQITGGGAAMYYLGTYKVEGERFTGEMTARRHAKRDKPSPILGLDEFHLKMEGIHSGGYAQVVGTILEVKGAILTASFSRLGDS
jgi:hypothetical protein